MENHKKDDINKQCNDGGVEAADCKCSILADFNVLIIFFSLQIKKKQKYI